MIIHPEIKNLVTEWGLRESIIEKDYVIGWNLLLNVFLNAFTMNPVLIFLLNLLYLNMRINIFTPKEVFIIEVLAKLGLRLELS